MGLIQYFPKNADTVTVKLGKKIVGEIQKVSGGYQYVTKRGRSKGNVYPSIQQVKLSLEGDSDE